MEKKKDLEMELRRVIKEEMERKIFSSLSVLDDESLKILHKGYEEIYNECEKELNNAKEKLDLINAEFTRRFTDES